MYKESIRLKPNIGLNLCFIFQIYPTKLRNTNNFINILFIIKNQNCIYTFLLKGHVGYGAYFL